jgi:hypothetical protein
MEDCDAAGHGLGDTLHEGRVLRTSQEPLAFPGSPRVDAGANVVEELRCVLDFVEDCRGSQRVHERARIAADARDHVWIFEEDIRRVRVEATQQSCLAALPRTREEHGGEGSARFQELPLERSYDVTHVRILRHHFRILKIEIRGCR